MKTQIKECKPFGKGGGHIVLSKEYIGKKFLVLPESSKYVLASILKQYHEALEEAINPLLSEFLNKKEFGIIKKVYNKKIVKIDKVIHKKFLQSSYRNLDKFRLNDIATILNDIIQEIPKELRKKLLREYYRND